MKFLLTSVLVLQGVLEVGIHNYFLELAFLIMDSELQT